MASWFQQLERAGGMAEVVSIARDYFSTWSPEEIARLPRACRPGRIRVAEDLEELNASAVEAYRSTRASGDELTALQLLTSFLSRATVRLAELRNPVDDNAALASQPGAERQPKASNR